MTSQSDARQRLLLATAGLLALLFLAGCADETDQHRDVVTATSGALTPPADRASDDTRPRLRLDMTQEEKLQQYEAHQQCLNDRGWPNDPGDRARVDRAKVEQMFDACKHLFPLPPWEYDKNNPEARSNVYKMVECLRQKGVKHVVAHVDPDPHSDRLGFSLGGGNDGATSMSKIMGLVAHCEKQVFGVGST